MKRLFFSLLALILTSPIVLAQSDVVPTNRWNYSETISIHEQWSRSEQAYHYRVDSGETTWVESPEPELFIANLVYSPDGSQVAFTLSDNSSYVSDTLNWDDAERLPYDWSFVHDFEEEFISVTGFVGDSHIASYYWLDDDSLSYHSDPDINESTGLIVEGGVPYAMIETEGTWELVGDGEPIISLGFSSMSQFDVSENVIAWANPDDNSLNIISDAGEFSTTVEATYDILYYVEISPDGRYVAFATGSEIAEVYIISTEDGTVTQLEYTSLYGYEWLQVSGETVPQQLQIFSSGGIDTYTDFCTQQMRADDLC